MDFIADYIYVLVTVGFLSAAFGLVAPGGGFNKSVKAVLGIVVILAVLGPISKLPSVISTAKIEGFSENGTNAVTNMEKVVKDGQKTTFKKNMEDYIKKSLKTAFNKEAEVSIDVLLGEGDSPVGINKVRVVLKQNGMVDPIAKIIVGENKEGNKNNNPAYIPIKNYISETFGVLGANIEVSDNGDN